MKTTWHITTQNQTTRPDAQGNFHEGIMVGFQTSNGLSGSVFVPNTQYNADNVKEMIQQRVNNMQEVHALTGGE